MSLIRYQSPELSTWPSFDRWIDLRDEMNSLFELPTMGNLTRQAQLFSGWTPALDLYQDNDNVIATVELPGMRKEDIDISLRDGVLGEHAPAIRPRSRDDASAARQRIQVFADDC